MSMQIRSIHAMEVLDSRGNPTVSAEVELEDGTIARGQRPLGRLHRQPRSVGAAAMATPVASAGRAFSGPSGT